MPSETDPHPEQEGSRSPHIELERLTRIVAEEHETLNGDELEHLSRCRPCLAMMRLAVRAFLQHREEGDPTSPESQIS